MSWLELLIKKASEGFTSKEIMSNISITPSDVIQYLYCPRFTYFEYVLAIPQYEEKSYKAMRGRELHDYKQKVNKDYLRNKIGVTRKHQEQYLTNDFLRGKVDEVLELGDGTTAPLDYKFANIKIGCLIPTKHSYTAMPG